jgi:hypothetical protein
MVCLGKIEELPPGDRAQAYRDLAAHFWALAEIVRMEGTRLVFADMARQMYERADAAAELAD